MEETPAKIDKSKIMNMFNIMFMVTVHKQVGIIWEIKKLKYLLTKCR